MASCFQNLERLFSLKLVIGSLSTVFLVYTYLFSKHLPHTFPKAARNQEWSTTEILMTKATTQRPYNMTLLPTCPDKPPNILEPVKLNLTNISLDELQTKYPSHPGDRYRPEECRSRQRLAVVIPYRDREQHLGILLNNLIPFLNKQQAEFTIFVAEQAPGGTFNRGLMINAGVAAALKADNFTCLVIHDVDLIPEISDNYYRCRKKPFHLSTANAKFNYKLPYLGYVGGNIAITPSQYKRINGFSNLYFGWGGEDDDFRKRMATFGLRVKRNTYKTGRYYAQSHGMDKGNPINPKRAVNMAFASAVKYQLSSDSQEDIVLDPMTVAQATATPCLDLSANLAWESSRTIENGWAALHTCQYHSISQKCCHVTYGIHRYTVLCKNSPWMILWLYAIVTKYLRSVMLFKLGEVK